MSLLDRFKEKFCFMEKVRTEDGAGGTYTDWHDGMVIDLIQRHDTTIEAQKAEKEGTASTYTFFHDKKIKTSYGDYLKRISDGQIFEITQDSGEDYTPASSALNLGTVTAKKGVLPK